jgi:hypothetical protein
MLEQVIAGLAVAAVAGLVGLGWKRWRARPKKHKGPLIY